MWWHGENGITLVGPQAALFRKGLSNLVDFLDDRDGETWEVDIPIFDRLSRPEKFAVLELAASALLVNEVPAPEVVAVNEAAVGAVYYQLHIDLDLEIDSPPANEDKEDATALRQLIVAACESTDFHDHEIPPHDSNDRKTWHELIEVLLDHILWDRDWLHEYVKPDDHPDDANAARAITHIDPKYYAAIAPDPTPAQLDRIKANLRQLCEG